MDCSPGDKAVSLSRMFMLMSVWKPDIETLLCAALSAHSTVGDKDGVSSFFRRNAPPVQAHVELLDQKMMQTSDKSLHCLH